VPSVTDWDDQLVMPWADEPLFGGETYEPVRDSDRLQKQLRAVRTLMEDGRWRTLKQISEATGYPEASISARLRDLRKRKFGAYQVERRHLVGGLWTYRVRP